MTAAAVAALPKGQCVVETAFQEVEPWIEFVTHDESGSTTLGDAPEI
jgi:hypothetical protein